jgi:cyclohexanecarboxylate-CoA ligase
MKHPLLPAAKQEEFRRLGYWEDLTLAGIVRDWADRDPHRIAITGPTQVTYGELWERARRLAGSLQEAGLEPGEYLLAVLPNSWQGIVAEVAASIAGAVFTPRSAHISPTLALNLFAQLDVRGLVLQADLLDSQDWRAALDTMSGRLAGRPVLLQGEPRGEVAALTLEAAAASGPLAEPSAHGPCQPSLVLSTGGTTGRPKSILHCPEALVYAARHFAAATGFTERDVHVAFAPYGHAGGSVFEIYMPLLHGASILPVGRWRAAPVAEAIERWGGTYLITMGTHIFDLLALGPDARRQLRSVRLATSGAGASALFEDGERELGFPIVRVYGCSECPGHAIGRRADPPEIRLRQDGIPFPGIEYRRVDLVSGQPAADGQPGEYQCRGPNLFMGYVGERELTEQAVTSDGFYRSGDLVVQSTEGYVNWSGRAKDIIRRGGLQIDPVEMEDLLSAHPKISMVVVVGEPHPRLGERAVVVAVPASPASPPTLDELCGHLLGRGLPKQCLPERLILAGDIPRTELGKFHRAEIRRQVAQEAQRATCGLPRRGEQAERARGRVTAVDDQIGSADVARGRTAEENHRPGLFLRG